MDSYTSRRRQYNHNKILKAIEAVPTNHLIYFECCWQIIFAIVRYDMLDQVSFLFNNLKDMTKTANITIALIRNVAAPIELYK